MKNKINNIFKKTTLIASSLSILLFVGCGEGSAKYTGVATTTVASCSGAISTWTTVSSGDVVVGDNGAVLKFDHDSNGDKKVCVVSGAAKVLGA